jgi:hypothetical protein
MMQQRLTEGIQHKLLMKLLEFDYSIEYKKGAENAVANVLSRKDHNILAITSFTPVWIHDIEHSYSGDTYYTQLLQQVLINAQDTPHYSVHSGILRYKGEIYIGSSTDLRNNILASLHSSITTTYYRIKRIFHWPQLKKYVKVFVSECPTCQRAKSEHCQYPGLLDPLPIPNMA